MLPGVRAVRQLLDVVRRELGATDAFIQVGGLPPSDPHVVAWALEPEMRLVARFEQPPESPAEVAARLEAVANAFAETVREAVSTLTEEVAVHQPATRRSLADSLIALALGARAVLAVVIDERSPVLWASSDEGLGLTDVPTALRLVADAERTAAAGVDPRLAGAEALAKTDDRELTRAIARLRTRFGENPAGARRDLLAARALAWVRTDAMTDATRHDTDLGVLVRRFAGIYRLVLAFDGPFSELIAEPITRRALPVIERLVSSLPPVDPTPEGARVVVLRPT